MLRSLFSVQHDWCYTARLCRVEAGLPEGNGKPTAPAFSSNLKKKRKNMEMRGIEPRASMDVPAFFETLRLLVKAAYVETIISW